MTDHHRFRSTLALCAAAFLSVWASAQAQPVADPLASKSLPSVSPLSNRALTEVRGKGATNAVVPGTKIAVILWDERGTPKMNQNAGGVDSVSQGAGNVQINNLTRN